MFGSNKRIGRTNIEAHQLTANLLVLNGHRFTSDDLLSRSTHTVLVQPQPTAVAPAAPAVVVPAVTPVAPAQPDPLATRVEQLETALVATRAAIQSAREVELERTAVKRNRHWYVGGRRVNASDLKGDASRYFVVARHSTVIDALQALAAEIDALHASRPLTASDNSNSSTN